MPGKSNPWNDRCMPIHPDNAIDELIAHLRRLPGVGRRSAERHAHAMLEWDEETLKALGDCISHLRERVAFCPVCGAIQDDAGCRLCNDPRRDQEIICVVEHFSQIPVIEKSGCYKGAYHVLGGRLQPSTARVRTHCAGPNCGGGWNMAGFRRSSWPSVPTSKGRPPPPGSAPN